MIHLSSLYSSKPAASRPVIASTVRRTGLYCLTADTELIERFNGGGVKVQSRPGTAQPPPRSTIINKTEDAAPADSDDWLLMLRDTAAIIFSSRRIIVSQLRCTTGIRQTASDDHITATRTSLQVGQLYSYTTDPVHARHSINPLGCKGNYTATSNNMKLVHWPFMGGLLDFVQWGGDWARPHQRPVYQ